MKGQLTEDDRRELRAQGCMATAATFLLVLVIASLLITLWRHLS